MKALPIINMINVAKATCLIDTKEQCAIAWSRVEEASANQARMQLRNKKPRSVIFNHDKLKNIKSNTLKIRRAEKEIQRYKDEINNIYLNGGDFFININ